MIYRCNKKYENDKKCDSGIVTEDEIKELFVNEFNKLNKNISVDYDLTNDLISSIDKDLKVKKKLESERTKIIEKDNQLIELSCKTNKDYISEHNELKEEFEKVSHGNPIEPQKTFPEGTIILTKNGQLSAVAKNANGTIKCEKVFI